MIEQSGSGSQTRLYGVQYPERGAPYLVENLLMIVGVSHILYNLKGIMKSILIGNWIISTRAVHFKLIFYLDFTLFCCKNMVNYTFD